MYDLAELAEASDAFRVAISDQADDLELERFGEAVLDSDLGPDDLLDAATADIVRLTGLSDDAARLALASGMLLGSALRVIHHVGQAALAPEGDEEDCN